MKYPTVLNDNFLLFCLNILKLKCMLFSYQVMQFSQIHLLVVSIFNKMFTKVAPLGRTIPYFFIYADFKPTHMGTNTIS